MILTGDYQSKLGSGQVEVFEEGQNVKSDVAVRRQPV